MNITATCLNPHSDNKAFAICCQISHIAGILCNLILLYGLVKDPLKCFRNCSSYLIMNNTFSDLLLCLYKFAKYYWRTCTDGLIVSRLFTAPLYISFGSIFFLALDRCFIACYPFKYRVFANGKKAMAVVIFQWLLAFFIIALRNDFEKAVPGFWLLSGIFFLLCSSLLYIKTVYHLKKEVKHLDCHSRNTGNTTRETSTRRRKQRNILKQTRFVYTMMCIAFLFLSTLLPLLVFDLFNKDHGYGDIIKTHVHMCLYFLFYFNFVINCVLYCCRLTKYRKTFKSLFCYQHFIAANDN